MQLSDIRTLVRYGLRETTASVWSNAEIDDQINLAQRYVASNLDVRFLDAIIKEGSETHGSPYYYALPADFMKMASDVNLFSIEYPLKTAQEARLIQGYDSNHPNYKQEVAWIQESEIHIWPTGSAYAGEDFLYYYAKWPDDLSGDSDVSEINDAHIGMVIDYATGLCYKKTDTEKSFALISFVTKQIKELNG